MKTKNLLIVALLLCATVMNAKVWRLNPNLTYDADFHTLQEAVDSRKVLDDDTIFCEAGYYKSGADITKRLVIIGTGYGTNDEGLGIISSEFATSIVIKHDSVKLIGITTNNYITVYNERGSYSMIERCTAREINVRDYCVVKNCLLTQYTLTAGDNAIITGNILSNSLIAGRGSYITNNTIKGYVETKNSQIKDNIIMSEKPFNNSYTGNTITHNILTLWTPITGFANNHYVEATYKGLFGKDEPDIFDPRQWRITSADEFDAKTSSSTGGECGAFGGAEPFRIGMRPLGSPFIYDVNIPSTITSDQLNINFKVGVQDE